MGRVSFVRGGSWAAGAGVAIVLSYFALRTPEPARTGLELVSALCSARPDEGLALFERHVADSLELNATDPELSSLEGLLPRSELLRQLEAFRQMRPSCSASLENWRVTPGAGGLSWLEGVLLYSDSQPGDLHAERRKLRAAFRQSAGEPQLVRVVLGAAERYDPEARP